MSDDTQRTIGEHGGRLFALEARTERIEMKLDAVAETLAQARGGWKTLMLVAGIAGAAGAIVSKIAGVAALIRP
jgi:hypothetical protein